EQNELLKAHHAEGLSASKSAAIFGVTRNAVIGKWKRMGMPPRKPAFPPRPKRPKQSNLMNGLGHSPCTMTRKRVQALSMVPEKQTESKLSPDDIPRQQRRTIATLGERHCRFPYGDPGKDDFFFCGGVKDGNSSYCAKHCRIAFNGCGRNLG